MDFHNGISCQRFELEGWGLVQCLLISFCFGSEILNNNNHLNVHHPNVKFFLYIHLDNNYKSPWATLTP